MPSTIAASDILLARTKELPCLIFAPLPKTLKKAPRLNQTVVAELTPIGRELSKVDESGIWATCSERSSGCRAALTVKGVDSFADVSTGS